MSVRIAPSILSADFARLGEEIADAAAGGADLFHLDVMDGHFVPNLTIGPAVVKAVRGVTDRPFDVHLMISEPQRYIDAFIEAGADMVSVHVEAEPHLHRALMQIRGGKAKAGVAINPGTALESLNDILEYCDYVLVMTVNPGFGGQKFIAPAADKVRRLRDLARSRNLSFEIEVDGGVDATNAGALAAAGATMLVAGSAVFGKTDRRGAIEAIRSAATSTQV
jgi:ribulose-phosphate 3-epimerase